MTIPSPETEHRDQPRRIVDIAIDDLYKTFSTSHCHSCLESMADAVLLLDSDRQSMYTSAHVDQLMNRSGMAFTLMPKFSLRDPVMASRFSAFVNGKIPKHGLSACCWAIKIAMTDCCSPAFACPRLPPRVCMLPDS